MEDLEVDSRDEDVEALEGAHEVCMGRRHVGCDDADPALPQRRDGLALEARRARDRCHVLRSRETTRR